MVCVGADAEGKPPSASAAHPSRRARAELKRLLDNLPLLQEADTFDELFHTVSVLIRPITKVGELAVYDTALRIGARLNLEPVEVYVHAGTRAGAVALGFDRRRERIQMDELPPAFKRLRPREAEDSSVSLSGSSDD